MIFIRKTGLFHSARGCLLLFLGTVLFLGCNRTDSYVLIPDRTTDLVAGSQVLIEDVVVGEVAGVQPSDRFPGNEVIRINLDKDYSIPSNSKVWVKNSKNQGKKIVQIVVVASKSYLNPGDTVFFSMPELPTVKSENSIQNFSEGVEYRVQVFASKASHSLDSPIFKHVENIEEVFDGALYRYYVGQFFSLAEAKAFRQTIVDRGIEDGFIVAFLNGERISLDQANQYEN
jgi:hypothetical protein